MFYYFYYSSYFILIPGILFALFAQYLIDANFNKYSKVKSNTGWVANEMCKMIAERYQIYGIVVQPIKGKLTDHFDPTTGIVGLSEPIHNSDSIAALAVSAHEMGHAMQKSENSILFNIRSILVPITRYGTMVALPLAIVGVVLEYLISKSGSNFGTTLIMLGIMLYSLTTLFSLVTLPIEIDASRRACKMLLETGAVDSTQIKYARKVLFSAALTYVANLLVSLLYLLRFIMILSSLRGNRD